VELNHFAAVARNYCEFVPIAPRYDLGERFATFAVLLAELYAAGLRLRHEWESDRGLDSYSIRYAPDERAELNETEFIPADIRGWEGFEDLTLYWHVDDPHDWSSPVVGSLSDDLLGIYRDLKRGLMMYDAGHIANAAWQWHTDFSRWGVQVVNALPAIHNAIRKTTG
jgi:hypothetical protein